MAKKLYQILAMFCIVMTLTTLGMGVWLLASGRLSAENRLVVGNLLRGKPLVEPVSPAPAESPSAAAVADRLAKTQETVERSNRLIERRKAELRAQRSQLAGLEQRIRSEREKLRRERLAWAEEIKATRQDKNDASFKAQLRLFDTLAAKQVKDIFMALPETQAAQYLAEMKSQTAADVIARFKSDQEKARLMRLLEHMRQEG